MEILDAEYKVVEHQIAPPLGPLSALAISTTFLSKMARRRRIGGQRDPVVASLLPYADIRGRKARVSKIANSNGNKSRKAVVLPEHGRAAGRTKMKSHRVAAFGCPRPLRRFTGENNLVEAKACLIANNGTGTPLACKAVTQRYARRFTFNRPVMSVAIPATPRLAMNLAPQGKF
jgi:hypothetical protein